MLEEVLYTVSNNDLGKERVVISHEKTQEGECK